MLARQDEPGVTNDELLQRAARQGQRDRLRAVQPDTALHIVDVPDTDLSDRRRYRFGLDAIDRDMKPMRPAGLTTLAALTGYGKTVMAEQLMVANASEYVVMFASLEQTSEEVRDSIIARNMALSLDEAAKEARERSERYRRSRSLLADLNLRMWRPAPRKPRTPEAIVTAAVAAKADMLIIDHFRYVDGWEAGSKANAMSKWFSEAAKETKIRIVMLAQLKYEMLLRRDTRPNMSDVADSSRLTQESDSVLFIHRPFADDRARQHLTEIICPKNRFGPRFRTHLTWNGPLRTYYSMDEFESANAECCRPRLPIATPPSAPKRTHCWTRRGPYSPSPKKEDHDRYAIHRHRSDDRRRGRLRHLLRLLRSANPRHRSRPSARLRGRFARARAACPRTLSHADRLRREQSRRTRRNRSRLALLVPGDV
jgi:hypothetical protein